MNHISCARPSNPETVWGRRSHEMAHHISHLSLAGTQRGGREQEVSRRRGREPQYRRETEEEQEEDVRGSGEDGYLWNVDFAAAVLFELDLEVADSNSLR